MWQTLYSARFSALTVQLSRQHVMKASLLPNWDLGRGTEVLLCEQGYCSHPLSGITQLTEKVPQTCPAQNPAPPWVQGKDMGHGP